MGGVRGAAPVEQAALEFIRAGGDVCLICHREEFITQAYEGLVKTAERDEKFAQRVAEAARRVLACKKKWGRVLHTGGGATRAPSPASVEKLTRRLWEFDEQVRLEMAALAGDGVA